MFAQVTKKATVVAIVAAGVLATSAVPTSAMSLNGTVRGNYFTTFGTFQKTERDTYMLVYWTGCSYSSPFALGLYINRPTSSSTFDYKKDLAYKSKDSMTLNDSTYSLTLGAVPKIDESAGYISISGTWDIPRGALKTPVNSEKAE